MGVMAIQMVCKPGSVRPLTRVPPSRGRDGHSSGTQLALRLTRPTRAAERERSRHARCLPPLFGLAPGGVYPALSVAGEAVRSYRTLSPLPGGPEALAGRFAFCGTFPGVAPAGR
jgi:hypothetical protein